MDAKSAQVASQPLKYQTWFLKVSIHCEGCRRKVKKVLRNIDGVFTATIDPQQHKVTVTGSVGVETLIRKLVKAGKPAEIWPENLSTGKGKASGGKAKKRNEQRDPESIENHSGPNAESNLCSAKNRGIENADNSSNGGKTKKNKDSETGGNLPENSPVPEQNHKGGEGEVEGGSVKKKKRKGQSQSGGRGSNGLSSGSESTSAPAHTGSQFQCSTGKVAGLMNLSPTRQQSYLYPETYYYPPLMYLATNNNRMCPVGKMGAGGPSYYVSPLPYMCAGLDHDPYQFQSAPLIPFEIFSDENANGCSIM